MLKKLISKTVRTSAKRMALAAALCSLTGITAEAEVTDLATSTIERLAPASTSERTQVQQVQAQVPQPPPQFAPQTQPQVPAAPAAPQPLQDLNFNPNANIDQLGQPAPPPFQPPAQNLNRNTALSRAGATAGGQGDFYMIGDLFGGSFAGFGGSQTVSFQQHAAGNIVSGGPGLASSIIAFEFGLDVVPNDVFTTGTGLDLAGGDLAADTFSIAEPLPPNDALTSPGPGFIFDGGTAVYTNSTGVQTAQPGIYQNGEQWFIDYSYTSTLTGGPHDVPVRPVPGPGIAARRVKISENFSPEVRDRFFASYNFFNDAFGGLGDISRYTMGFERMLVDDLISVEARMPFAGTYGSTQNLDRQSSRDFELGNATFIGKGVLLRTDRWLWSGGMGVSVPLADDTKIQRGGQNILVVKNKSVHLIPFMGLLMRYSRDTSFQGFIQVDVAANGDDVFGNLQGGNLPQLGTFNDSTLLELDVAASHVLYRACDRCARVRQVSLLSELHYTGTLQDSDFVSDGGNLTYTNLKRNFNVLNATTGFQVALGDNVIITPAMSVPLRDGLDEQFDYEAIVNLNYLR
ncbi:MAG: hypothetical protein AB8B91_07710 [Rubripirellula sp.]